VAVFFCEVQIWVNGREQGTVGPGPRLRVRGPEERSETIAHFGGVGNLRRIKRFIFMSLVIAMVSGSWATAQSTEKAGNNTGNPVAQVRNEMSWEYGPFVQWGKGVGNRSSYEFLAAGFQLGKVLTPVVHAGFLSGQFEYAGNIMPLWQAYTPAAHFQQLSSGGRTFEVPIGGGTFRGVSLTPVILRWNFLTNSHRIQPWFQGAGGLIYTTHKFPPDILVPHGTPGGTSVWNFSPQGGVGIHYFLRPKRSVDLGLNAVHISSASLGDKNPGVNALVQLQVNYTFWK
jgi:lipid A 3-O-deacylase